MAPAAPIPEPIPDRVRLPLNFDAEALAADLLGIGDGEWIGHVARGNYEGRWDIIPLRSAEGETHPLRLINTDPAATRFVDTPWLAKMPAVRSALGRLRCELRSVRLMRLAAGSTIKEHSDMLDADLGMLRLHVPVTTSPEVDFRLAGRRVEMAPGSLWYLRLTEKHSVANRGTGDRIHLVIDTMLNGWLERMLREGSAGP
jgi:Aspartyl/Asparaginyl beta-hydroxylase